MSGGDSDLLANCFGTTPRGVKDAGETKSDRVRLPEGNEAPRAFKKKSLPGIADRGQYKKLTKKYGRKSICEKRSKLTRKRVKMVSENGNYGGPGRSVPCDLAKK